MVYFFGQDISTPSDLLQNEWAIFIGVFLLTFAIIYFSISGFFSTKKAATLEDLLRGKGDKKGVHPAALIISLVISGFTAVSVVQEDLVRRYFGNVLTIWIGVFIFIVLIIISMPFWKSLKNALGNGKFATVFANSFFVLCFWASLKFLLPPESIYYLPYDLQSSYEWFVSAVGLSVLLVIGFFAGLIFGKRNP